MAPHHRQCLLDVAGVDVHLPAARLLVGKDDGMSQPFQDLDRGLPCPRKQSIHETGHEERDLQVRPSRGRSRVEARATSSGANNN
jgi:hypothetical protein